MFIFTAGLALPLISIGGLYFDQKVIKTIADLLIDAQKEDTEQLIKRDEEETDRFLNFLTNLEQLLVLQSHIQVRKEQLYKSKTNLRKVCCIIR